MNKYETIFITDPDIASENVDEIIEEVQNLISGSGGEVEKLDNWGKKRLAYEVRGNKDGNYVLISFNADPQFIQRLERYYGLTEQIIKHMTVRAEKLPEFGTEVEKRVRDEDEDGDKDLLYDRFDGDEDEEGWRGSSMP